MTRIRPYTAEDAAELLAAVRESLADLEPWMPWATAEYAESDAAAWVRLTEEGHASGSMYVDNTRSRRVAEKAGAQFDAVLRKRLLVEGRAVDALLFSFVRPD